MLLGSGRHSRRRGERRRRAEAAADAAATRLFPLTLDGFDDSWANDAPAGDGPVPWWLDIDDEDVVLAAVVPTAATARSGGTEQVAGLDRYSAEFDLPFVVPAGRPDKEVEGDTAKFAGMPDADDPSRRGGRVAARDWSGPPVGTDDTVRDDTVRAVDEEPVHPWAAVEDERAASGNPWTDGAEPVVEVDPRPTAAAAPVFDDDREAALGADTHASGPADGPPGADGDGGARRYVFLEAATRYATDDETFGIDGEPATDDPAAYAYVDEDPEDVTVVGGAPVPPPRPPHPPLAVPRRAGGRRALLAAVPLVLIAAAGAVWAATSSPGPDGDDRTATRVAAPETTTTTAPTFGLSVEPVVPPVDTTATTAPPPPTTLPWANRTTTTVRQPTTATTPVTTTAATVAPNPVTPPATVAPTTVATTTTAPPTTVATTTTAPPTTTTTTTTTVPPTTTTTVAEQPPGDPPQPQP